MNDKGDCLFEIGCEELPPDCVQTLPHALQTNLARALEQANLAFDGIRTFATPRRLALMISGLDKQQDEQQQMRRGPAVDKAFAADGKPTQAALGFAKSCAVPVEALHIHENEQGKWLQFKQVKPGQLTRDLLPSLLEKTIASLPIKRPMRWADADITFARPVHWVVLVHGDDCIKASILGVQTGRQTRGHRFHSQGWLTIDRVADYAEILSQAYVMADFDKRKAVIKKQLTEQAEAQHGQILLDPALLNEVTSLVEWPVALTIHFDRAFLDMPAEVLITAIESHQKCFPMHDDQGQLLPCCVTLSNLQSQNPEQVIAGNARVIRARLADAAFFFANDRKRALHTRVDALGDIIFQTKLGSLGEKCARIVRLSGIIADELGEDVQLAKRAALLAKCDLVTDMVDEFPSLQGIMGRYYAEHDQENDVVVQAIQTHYLPRFSKDALPPDACGAIVAIADRIDTLVGIVAIGKKPKGDKDPFALRRQALGLLRILIEKQYPLELPALISEAMQGYTIAFKSAFPVDLMEFIWERLRAWYADKGIATEIYLSVKALNVTSPLDFHQRIEAVSHFIQLPEADALAIANKRISHLLHKADFNGQDEKWSAQHLELAAEKQLAKLVNQLSKDIAPLLLGKQYKAVLIKLATLRDSVDHFFDEVMVMVDNEVLRNNRLMLLKQLHDLFREVADVALLSNQVKASA